MSSTKEFLDWVGSPEKYGPKFATDCGKIFEERGIGETVGEEDALAILGQVLADNQVLPDPNCKPRPIGVDPTTTTGALI